MLSLILTGLGLGLSTGTACAAHCLPVYLALLAGSVEKGRALRRSLSVTGQFLLGRLAAYLIVGLFLDALRGEIRYEHYGEAARGLMPYASILVALLLLAFSVGLFAGHSRVCALAARCGRGASLPLLAGFLAGLAPCVPFFAAVAGAMAQEGRMAGTITFAAFFAGTSVYFLPFAALGLLERKMSLERFCALGKAAAAVLALVFLQRGLGAIGMEPPGRAVGISRADLAELLPEMKEFRPGRGAGCLWAYERESAEPGRRPDAVAFVTSMVAPERSLGYGGPVPVLVAIDPEGMIRNLKILDNNETPEYASGVYEESFLGRFKGKSYRDDFGGVDAVTGATVTSRAIIGGVGEALRAAAASELGLEAALPERAPPAHPWAESAAILSLFAFAFAGYLLGRRGLRVAVLAVSFVALGLVLGRFFSIGDIYRLFSGIRLDGTAQYILVGLSAACALLVGRLYCGWLCPFGALTELAGRLFPLRMDVPPRMDKALRALKYIILVAALGAAFATLRTSVFTGEPFEPTFRFLAGGKAAPMALSLIALLLAAGLVIDRFWCRYLCPAGAAMAFLSRAKLLPRGRRAYGCRECAMTGGLEFECLVCGGAHGGSSKAILATSPALRGVIACLLIAAAVGLLACLALPHGTPANPSAGPGAPAPAEIPKLPRSLSSEEISAADLSTHEAMYWNVEDGKVGCLLCPTHCLLAPGERGVCKVRINLAGRLRSLVYGKIAASHVDPIEKKPLFHVEPGSGAFSIATAGCNLGCIFCQNWELSQAFPEKTRHEEASPREIVEAAIRSGCRSIAYTYNEPTIFYEFMLDTAKLARSRGLRNVWITSGYINPEPLKDLSKCLDAANVDLKGFSEEFYREYCNAHLAPVLETLRVLKREGVWIEITNLIIPEANDDPEMIRKMCRWIVAELGADIPLHFSRYHPAYNLKRPPTPAGTLQAARDVARGEGLRFVYIGNIPGEGYEDTSCPNCKRVLIERRGYAIIKDDVVDGKCAHCNAPIPGLWKR